MKFNSTKCKVMLSGTNNENFCYKLGAHQLEMVQEEKDSHLISQSHDDYRYQGEAAMKKESVILECAGMLSSTGREHHFHKVLENSNASGIGHTILLQDSSFNPEVLQRKRKVTLRTSGDT